MDLLRCRSKIILKIHARHPRQPRCTICLMSKISCLCEQTEKVRQQCLQGVVSAPFKVWLLMHWKEAKTTTNTGIFSVRALPGSRVLIYGLDPLERHSPPASVILDKIAGSENADVFFLSETCRQEMSQAAGVSFLFPHQRALGVKEVFSTAVIPSVPHIVIIPDGTWSQAKRIARKFHSLYVLNSGVSEALDQVPFLKLDSAVSQPSQYQLRHTPHAYQVSTLEAIAQVAREQGCEDLSEALTELLRLKVSRTLEARGTPRVALT